MWISLGLIVVLSAVVREIEQNSETQIKAAVYDESGEYVELLEAYDGVVVFEQYESEDAVQRAVLKGSAECGYVLSSALPQEMASMHEASSSRSADGGIVVYQDADAVAVPVVNEILFERIFRQVSLKWFGDYISQNDVFRKLGADEERLRKIAEECFDREIMAGTTFRFEIRRLAVDSLSAEDDNAAEEKRTVYPVYMVAVIAVALCALQGIMQVVIDVREQNFYKRNRWQVSVLTLLLPLMLGGLCALMIIMTAMG